MRENEELKTALRGIETRVANANATSEETERLLYALGHDLRTPLRTISAYAQLLDRQSALNSEAREMTSFIVKAADEMKMLIEDLLKYSRIAPSPPRTQTALGPVLQWAALNLQTAFKESGAQLETGDLPELVVNEAQFVQLFEQLLSNAIKFRGANTPHIEVSAEESEDGYLISVRDNGMGIEPQFHEIVFAPFKRLHGKEIPGSGLGLSICRKIVRAHGGRIWIESEPHQGAAVRFHIPN